MTTDKVKNYLHNLITDSENISAREIELVYILLELSVYVDSMERRLIELEVKNN